MRWVILALLLLSGCERIETSSPGEKAFQAAVSANAIFDRKENLNIALQELLSASPKTSVYKNSAKVFYLLGNTPWGIYYLYQALKLEPRNTALQDELDKWIAEAALPPRKKANPFGPLIRWHQILSQGEKFQVLFAGLITLFLIASFWIWKEGKVLRIPLLFLGLLCAMMAGSLLYDRYGASLEGVLIKPAALYREPDAKALLVKDSPLPAGLKLEVLGERDEGRWLKVKTEQGEYGYVGFEAMRLLD